MRYTKSVATMTLEVMLKHGKRLGHSTLVTFWVAFKNPRKSRHRTTELVPNNMARLTRASVTNSRLARDYICRVYAQERPPISPANTTP